jgi:hypothetical protein
MLQKHRNQRGCQGLQLSVYAWSQQHRLYSLARYLSGVVINFEYNIIPELPGSEDLRSGVLLRIMKRDYFWRRTVNADDGLTRPEEH